MGRKLKTAGILVNTAPAPALLCVCMGQVLFLKWSCLSKTEAFQLYTAEERGRLFEALLGKILRPCLSLIRCSQLTDQWMVVVTGIPKIEQFVYKSNRFQSYVKILIISKITFIFDTKIKMLTPFVQFPTITSKTATNSGSKTAFVSGGKWEWWTWTSSVCALLNGAIQQGWQELPQ